tara:strand:+ start:1851 stop:3311 length:1461 start_codon:yes stop_codon:yes gene_type:complete
MASNNYNTSSIEYNYNISRGLYENKDILVKINKELDKLISNQIEIIKRKFKPTDWNKGQVSIVKNFLFKDEIQSMGEIGLIQKEKFTNVDKMKEFITKLNIREKMSVIRNFLSQSDENNCLMYSILLEYKQDKKNGLIKDNTWNKYPMLNTGFLDYSVDLVEKIIGFNIEETNKRFTNLNGSEEILGAETRNSVPLFYKLMQKSNKGSKNPITLCWLWHALVYGVSYQDVLKLPSENLVKKMAFSFQKVTNNEKIKNCMLETYRKYPLFPKLSAREKNFLKGKNSKANIKLVNEKNLDIEIPPYDPPICFTELVQPKSFTINILDRYKKYYVSNLSGHVMLFITMAKYFKDIDTNLIILANLIFMVPYHHSIHEIFQASKIMDVYVDYDYKQEDLINVNKLLTNSELPTIEYINYLKNNPTNEKRIPNSITETENEFNPKFNAGKKIRKNNKKNKNTKKVKNHKRIIKSRKSRKSRKSKKIRKKID